MTDPALLHWRRNLADIADSELFEVVGNTLTVLLAELHDLRGTKDGTEIRFMLAGLRDEVLRRHAAVEHFTPEPRGNG